MSYGLDSYNPTPIWNADLKQNVRNHSVSVQTINNSPNSPDSFTLSTHTVARIDVTVTALDDTNGDGATFVLTGTWLRGSGSSLTQVQAPTVVSSTTTTGLSTATAVLAVSTSTVSVTVTGINSKTIRWGIVRQVQEVLA